jgi:hypothetical protein
MCKLIFWFLLLSSTSFAQKIVSDKTNKFDNSRIIFAETIKFGDGIKMDIRCQYVAVHNDKDTLSSTSIVTDIYFKPKVVTSVNESSSVIIKFNDGSTNEIPYEGRYNSYISDEVARIWVTFSDETIDKVNKNGISMIRIHTSRKNIDFDVSEKENKKIIASIKAVNERMSH